MTTVYILALILAVYFATLALLAVWSRRADRMRPVAVGLFLLGIPLLAGASLEALSWPRPIWAMWDLSGEFRVLGAKIVEGEAIYAYVDTDGEPRSIKLPWSNKTAEELQALFDDPANGGQAMMRFDPGIDPSEPTFWPLPQIADPPKKPAPAVPHLDI